MRASLRTAGKDSSRSRPHSADVPAAETVGRARCSGGEQKHSHGSPGSVEVLPKMPAQSTARSPFQEPRLLHEGPGASPSHQQVVRRWPSGRQERGYGSSGPRRLKGRQVGLLWRRDESGAQVPGSGFVACPRWSAPRLGQHSHHPSPQAAVAARDPRSSAEDPLPGASVFVPLTDPLHHAGQTESPRPVPASSQLRSLA